MGDRKHWRAAVLTGICLGLVGCQDPKDPVAPRELPGPQFVIAPDDEGSGGGSDPGSTEDPPNYGSESEIPPEYWSTTIYSLHDAVTWYGASADGYGEMTYVGNRARITLDLTVLHDYSTVATHHTAREDSHLLPLAYYFNNGYSFATAKDCGQVASQSGQYEAKTVVLVNWSLFTTSSLQLNGSASAAQPECPPPDDPGTGGGDDYTGGGEVWCLVEFWYDMETGEIVDYEILYCWVEN